LALGRTAIAQGPTRDVSPESADIHDAPWAWIGLARVVAQSLVLVALSAFGILVLLPAAVAAQAPVPT
jgi:hypothetical protein